MDTLLVRDVVTDTDDRRPNVRDAIVRLRTWNLVEKFVARSDSVDFVKDDGDVVRNFVR